MCVKIGYSDIALGLSKILFAIPSLPAGTASGKAASLRVRASSCGKLSPLHITGVSTAADQGVSAWSNLCGNWKLGAAIP